MVILSVNLRTRRVTVRWVAVTTDSRDFDLRHAGSVKLNTNECPTRANKCKHKLQKKKKNIIKYNDMTMMSVEMCWMFNTATTNKNAKG